MSDFLQGVWEFTRGDTSKRRFTVRDIETLIVQDITSWSAFRMTAKGRVTDADVDAVISKTLAGGGIVKLDPTNGVIEITIDPADTAGVPFEEVELFADVQGIDPTGAVSTGIRFLMRILPDPSRTSP